MAPSPWPARIGLCAALAALGACDSAPGPGSAPSATAPAAVSASAAPEPAPSGPPPREIAGALQILVAYKGAEGAPPTVTRSKADASKRAEEALAKVKEGKASFADVVKQYTDDPFGKATGGATGNFERSGMPPAFSDAAFALEVGQVSSVVETPRGFHVIQRIR